MEGGKATQESGRLWVLPASTPPPDFISFTLPTCREVSCSPHFTASPGNLPEVGAATRTAAASVQEARVGTNDLQKKRGNKLGASKGSCHWDRSALDWPWGTRQCGAKRGPGQSVPCPCPYPSAPSISTSSRGDDDTHLSGPLWRPNKTMQAAGLARHGHRGGHLIS